MSIAATDLVWYGSEDMPEDDSSAVGGAIDETVRVVPDSASLFNTLNDTIEVLSDDADDTDIDVIITGRDASGAVITDTINTNGTSAVAGAETFERIEKIEIDGVAEGTITVRKATGDNKIVDIEPGVLEIRRLMIGISADASGGAERKRYEKIFLKNNHDTLAYLGVTISEDSDSEGQLAFAIEDTVDGSGGSANRATAPADITGDGFSSTAKSIPGANLGPGEAIGVWVEVTMPAGDPATKTTYGLKASGSSI